MRFENQRRSVTANRNVEAELFYRDLMSGETVLPRRRKPFVEDAASEAVVGQARISGQQYLVEPAGAAIARAPSLDAALLAALGRRRVQWVILGDALGGASFGAHTWGTTVSPPAPRTIEFDTTDAAVLAVDGGNRVYLQARPAVSSAADKLAWVHVPSVEEFLRLPATQRGSQRDDWVRFVQRASVDHPVTRSPFTAVQLRALASPVLRLLLADNASTTLPVGSVTRDGTDRGGVVNGVTLPMLRYPISEPQVYLRVISSVEGKMESINAWDAGAGISLGPIQINVQREALFRFLLDVWQQDRRLFTQALGSDWSMREAGGHPELSVRVAGSDVWLRATSAAEERRSVAYFQSGDPARPALGDIDANYRRRQASRFAALVAWPHVQELLEDASAAWLRPGLTQIHAAGIPALDPNRPDRDLFVLKSLLLSTYVRFSGCLAPLLTALAGWATVRDKLANWRAALAAMGGACSAGGNAAERARNAELTTRLDRQVRDAQSVFTALEGILEARRPGAGTPATATEQANELLTRCGFSSPGVFRNVQDVRQAIRDAAVSEWNRWHTSVGVRRRENDIATFGHLVRYYLSAISSIRPDTLTAVQAATGGPVTYDPVPATGATDADIRAWAARVAQQLLAGAASVTASTALETQVARAVARARHAHLDSGSFSAWSAAWVTSCLRSAGIGLALEAMHAGRHAGIDKLLLASTRHSEYTLEAHRRRTGPSRAEGTYHAFPPTDHAPAVGDIVVQDRQARAPAVPLTYAQIDSLSGGRELHGDIVVERLADHVVAIGGNLGGSCRKRRYPIRNDKLVVERDQLYVQEDDSGLLPALPATTTTPLHVRSTLRILSLLSPVELCAVVPGQPYRGGILV